MGLTLVYRKAKSFNDDFIWGALQRRIVEAGWKLLVLASPLNGNGWRWYIGAFLSRLQIDADGRSLRVCCLLMFHTLVVHNVGLCSTMHRKGGL